MRTFERRPARERRDRPLPPESTAAMTCSRECTFCRDCAELPRHGADRARGIPPDALPMRRRHRSGTNRREAGPSRDCAPCGATRSGWNLQRERTEGNGNAQSG
ncbi:DUF1272 domain-containing protein [Rhodanobacter aciditrophus]|uniref:DUF1272 domain-containing protein n=1 Tax=Rhodanobacter aciditrophus TaxID=1623218 RepID=UPI003CF6BF06